MSVNKFPTWQNAQGDSLTKLFPTGKENQQGTYFSKSYAGYRIQNAMNIMP